MTRPRSTTARASRGALAVLCLAAPLVAAGCTGGSSSSSSGGGGAAVVGTPGAAATSLQDAYEAVIRQDLPSVVQITTDVGLGSGVVFDKTGDVVTNAHVVGSAKTFQVRFSNASATYPATLVGSYPPDDLAVIRVEHAPALTPATFGDSSKVVVGAIVLAMGNPLGLSSSVTNGIVSAVGRTVAEPVSADSPGATLPNVIQTSASINPGNSGGALVDLTGAVIGIPTLAATDPQLGGGAAPGIGFAIPANLVKDIAGQLVLNGRVTDSHRAALGLTVTTVTDTSGQPTGVGVVSVTPGGPAASAGLQPGDVITSIAGQQVTDATSLSAVLAGLQVGQAVPVTVERGNGQRTITVTLGQLPGS
ncbi:MAG: peptidase and chymotrypsin/Hap [Mycobacterium sp.]|jgi:putative serine protease PepD|nr:peptidase and chymotrypsin/Hap [Mycobacterium sp.]